MKNRRIGRALERELWSVRMDERLASRILAEAARQDFRRRHRRKSAFPTALVAAMALVLLAGGALALLSLGSGHPDLRREAALAPGDGGGTEGDAAPWHTAEPTPSPAPALTPTPTPAPTAMDWADMPVAEDEPLAEEDADSADNLFLYAAAFDGGVLAVESSYQYFLTVFDTEAPDESWQAGTVTVVESDAEAEKVMDGMVSAAMLAQWRETHDAPTPMSVQYSQVEVALAENDGTLFEPIYDEQDIPAVDEYHFVENEYLGNELTLYLAEGGEWTADAVKLAVTPRLREWVYDGEGVLYGRTGYYGGAVRRLSDDAFEVDLESPADAEGPVPETVRVPVDRGSAALRYDATVSWMDADTGEDGFAFRAICIDFDDGVMALILEPTAEGGLTARMHTVERPTMTLDARRHPGMAGWIFPQSLDEADVLEIVDERGARHTYSMEEFEGMLFGEVTDYSGEETVSAALYDASEPEPEEEIAYEINEIGDATRAARIEALADWLYEYTGGTWPACCESADEMLALAEKLDGDYPEILREVLANKLSELDVSPVEIAKGNMLEALEAELYSFD